MWEAALSLRGDSKIDRFGLTRRALALESLSTKLRQLLRFYIPIILLLSNTPSTYTILSYIIDGRRNQAELERLAVSASKLASIGLQPTGSKDVYRPTSI